MSFWEDLSPAVKTYLVIAGVLIAIIVAFNACSGPDAPTGGGRSTRGYQGAQ